jgi:hypothetical protein
LSLLLPLPLWVGVTRVFALLLLLPLWEGGARAL